MGLGCCLHCMLGLPPVWGVGGWEGSSWGAGRRLELQVVVSSLWIMPRVSHASSGRIKGQGLKLSFA